MATVINDLEADRIYRLSHGERSPEEQRALDRWRIAEVTRNADPEARIETMIHELAYERVKHSYLFNSGTLKTNAEIDAKADELAGRIIGLVETWIASEVRAAAKRDSEEEMHS